MTTMKPILDWARVTGDLRTMYKDAFAFEEDEPPRVLAMVDRTAVEATLAGMKWKDKPLPPVLRTKL